MIHRSLTISHGTAMHRGSFGDYWMPAFAGVTVEFAR
jgi:hypothetical protein